MSWRVAADLKDLDWAAQEVNDGPRRRSRFRKPIEEIGELLLR